MREQSKRSSWDIFIRAVQILFIAVILALVVLAIVYRDKISVDMIVNILPDGWIAAAIALVFIYALKSLSIFFPIVVLQIAAGFVFPTPIAIVVGILGAWTEVTVPFLLAKHTSSTAILSMISKKPKIKDIIDYVSQNDFMTSFILRAVGFVSLDIVSMVLGKMNFDYKKFALGSLLGMMPGIIVTAFMGDALADPTSPKFIMSVSIYAGLAILTAAGFISYVVIKNKRQRKQAGEEANQD